MTPVRPAPRWGVVVPVKDRRTGKSRLAPLGDEVRRAVATAIALDTVAAVAACPEVGEVLVVTDDVALAGELRALGVPAIPDGESGLNRSLRQGAAELVRRRPGARPVAVCADLPALSPSSLADLLRRLPSRPAFVSDVAGLGTTLYAAPSPEVFDPRFGPASRAAHLAAGAIEVEGPPTVVHDVDTPADLMAAAALGLGPRTAAVVAQLGPLGPR